MMRIAFDDRPLYSAHQHRGTGWYTKRLIEALLQFFPTHKYLLFSEYGKKVMNADLIHYPYFDPFSVTLPFFKIKPYIVTVHDLIPLIFPQQFPAGTRGRIKLSIQLRNLERADAIITDSLMSKRDISRFIHFNEEDIFVIPLAPGNEFRNISNDEIAWKTRSKYLLPDIFGLYVGDVNYHKNVLTLLSAFQTFQGKYPDVHLVLVGEAWQNAKLPEVKILREYVISHSLEHSVHFLGHVPTEDLVHLYNLALCYIQPSLYEGFGLPVIEAMACGCPVLVSNILVHREICGNTATYFDPHESSSLAKSLSTMMNLELKQLKRRRKAVLNQSKHFTWHKVARQTLDVYRYILKKP